MTRSAAEQAMFEGYELRVCTEGHILVTDQKYEREPCRFDVDSSVYPIQRCNAPTWWLLDDAAVEACFKLHGVLEARDLWVFRWAKVLR